ncbi:DDE superfamily endonuclease [Popillia japonica]|uniref:DDE superfamily endonuclease n=1 Tax=Popillia japonica TaxID=7064 RepID=A0AAW1KFT3_POPJA
MTSKLQPMDQGIIKNVKFHYRKWILLKIINAIEKENTTVIKQVINLRECISELAKVWGHEVRESTIQHCFPKTGFCEVAVNWDREDELPLRESTIQHCFPKTGFCEVAVSRDVDEHIVTIDDDILKSVTSNSEIAADDDDEEDDSDEPVRKPTNEDMITAK